MLVQTESPTTDRHKSTQRGHFCRLSRIVRARCIVVVAIGVATGLTLLVSSANGEPPVPGKTGPVRDTKKRVDQQGDPLPEHALSRIGTTRLRHEDQTR